MKKTFLIILINFFSLNAFSQNCDSLFSYPTEGPSSLQCLENIMFTEDGGWGFLLTAGVEDSTESSHSILFSKNKSYKRIL